MRWRSALRTDFTARCSVRGGAAELATFAVLTVLGQPRRVRQRSALRAPTPALRCSSLQKSPLPGTACRAATVVLFCRRANTGSARRARAGCAAPRRRRASQGVWPRAQRASTT